MTDETDKPRRAPFQRRQDAGERSGGGEGGRFAKRPFNRRDEPQQEEAPSGERIAKRLARAGISSRREAEALITDGRVRVNGQVLSSPAFNVQPGDRIELDGQAIPEAERTRLFLFHKPAGVVSTNRDPEGRKTVFDVLPEGLPRVMSVGRLDINTEGLLLLTNDGGLARVLELPETGWLRRYRVRVHGAVDEEKLKSLSEGIAVEGVFYGAIEAELERTQGSNAWLTLGLREGKNREVKNVLGALGLEVNRLIRVSYGPFQLGELEEGQVQEIKGRTLRDQLGERLIAESGADFEAEVRQPFSNRPTARGNEPATPAPRREAARPEPGEGGLIKNRKRERERFRADGLERLGTRSGGFGAKPFGGGGFGARSFGKGFAEKRREAEERYEPRPRSANVWMGPGARPQGAKAAAAPRPVRQDDDRPFKPRGPRPEGGRGSWEQRDHRRDAQPEHGERRPWQPRERREEAAGAVDRAPQREFRPPRDGEGRGEGREFRPRRPREGSERSEGFNAGERRDSRPRSEGEGPPQRRFDDRPRENRGGEGRPFRERPAGDRPRSFSGESRPEGAKPYRAGPRPEGGAAKPHRERPRTAQGERPNGGKPFRSGPRPEAGAKPYRPADGGRPFDKRPRPAGGDRPERREGRPSGTRPSGGKPGGRPGGDRPGGGGGKRPFKPPFKPRGDR